MPNDDADEEDFLEKTLGLQNQAPRILHWDAGQSLL
jgi:hypothetical protein